MKRKKNRVEKLKVMIGGKLTEIDFEDKFSEDSCSDSDDEHYLCEKLKKKDKCSRPRFFKFIERVRRNFCDFHKRPSYSLVRNAFYGSLNSLLYSDRQLISDYFESDLNYNIASNRNNMNMDNFKNYRKALENKLEELIWGYPLEETGVKYMRPIFKEKSIVKKLWNDKKRRLKSPFKIQEISKKWSSEQWQEYEKFLVQNQITRQALWEIYLKKFEKYQREETIAPKKYDKLAEKIPITNDLNERKSKGLSKRMTFFKPYVALSMKILSKREREIIKGIFWGNKSESQLAKKLSISRDSVSGYKKTALLKLRHFFEEIEREAHLHKALAS